MFLNKEQIKDLIANKQIIITPFEENNLKAASYTFRLGKIAETKQTESEISILPGQFLLLESLEEINFPENMLGILSTRGSIAKQGLDCLLSSTIVEPGSTGKIIFETKNQSDQVVTLKIGQPLVKCIFLTQAA